MTFRKGGFDFTVEAREGDAVLLRKAAGNYVGWEVAIVDRHHGIMMGGRRVEPSEFLPSSEQWGAKGWTYSDRESAVKKFQEVASTQGSKG